MKMLLEFDYKKATQAINYFVKKEGDQIDKLKLIKLIYLADRFHVRRYGRPIFNDAYMAMRLGPVGSSVKDIAEFSDFLDENERAYAADFLAKGVLDNTVASRTDVDLDVFSKSELEALDFAYDEFGGKSASTLVNVTHRYPEWMKFKEALESKETTREPMSYSDFFKNPAGAKDSAANGEDKFALPADVLAASKELFDEDYKVAEFWKLTTC
jgi:uncharacterized phage-associated protein